MPNTYKNKVVYGNQTLIDLTSDTVTPDKVMSGTLFHLPTGEPSVGSMSIQYFFTGSSTPLNTIGSDDDLYFQTTIVYKKVNGSWVSQSDLGNITSVVVSGDRNAVGYAIVDVAKTG